MCICSLKMDHRKSKKTIYKKLSFKAQTVSLKITVAHFCSNFCTWTEGFDSKELNECKKAHVRILSD